MTTPSITARTGGPPANIARAIRHAADRTGVSFEYLVDQARLESGFRNDVKATTSSATGLYQFTNGTWLSTVRAHGARHGIEWAASAISENGAVHDPAQRHAILALRKDPAIAALMAAEHAEDNRNALIEGTGREPDDTDLYLAHFLGSAGAVKFLNNWAANPASPAAELFPEAAGANRSVFFDRNGHALSLDEVRRGFTAKLAAEDAPAHLSTSQISRNFENPGAAPLELQAIRPMPKSLSLDFAQDAYRRIASGGRK